ncbi:hypothetical protein HDU85_006442 [Gaertneriomyces sp. JEL0708]|nr:hypothetical protein HDU85_006442 [Gaertneriomyces sp. JEL0708]
MDDRQNLDCDDFGPFRCHIGEHELDDSHVAMATIGGVGCVDFADGYSAWNDDIVEDILDHCPGVEEGEYPVDNEELEAANYWLKNGKRLSTLHRQDESSPPWTKSYLTPDDTDTASSDHSFMPASPASTSSLNLEPAALCRTSAPVQAYRPSFVDADRKSIAYDHPYDDRYQPAPFSTYQDPIRQRVIESYHRKLASRAADATSDRKIAHKVTTDFQSYLKHTTIQVDNLRPQQRDALEHLARMRRNRFGVDLDIGENERVIRGTIVMPTGAGKALTSLLAPFYLRPRKFPILYLCARLQPLESLYMQLTGGTPGSSDWDASAVRRFLDEYEGGVLGFKGRDFFGRRFVRMLTSEFGNLRRDSWVERDRKALVMFAGMKKFMTTYEHLLMIRHTRQELISPGLIIVDEPQLWRKSLPRLIELFPTSDILCTTTTPPLNSSSLCPIVYESTYKECVENGTIKCPVWYELELNVRRVKWGGRRVKDVAAGMHHAEFRDKLLKSQKVRRCVVDAVVQQVRIMRCHGVENACALVKCRNISDALAYERLFGEYFGRERVVCVTSRDEDKQWKVRQVLEDEAVLVVVVVEILGVSFHEKRVGVVCITYELGGGRFLQVAGRSLARGHGSASEGWGSGGQCVILTVAGNKGQDSWRFWKCMAELGWERAVASMQGGTSIDGNEKREWGDVDGREGAKLKNYRGIYGISKLVKRGEIRVGCVSAQVRYRDALVQSTSVSELDQMEVEVELENSDDSFSDRAESDSTGDDELMKRRWNGLDAKRWSSSYGVSCIGRRMSDWSMSDSSMDDPDLYCDTCRTQLTTKDGLRKHFRSRRHINNTELIEETDEEEGVKLNSKWAGSESGNSQAETESDADGQWKRIRKRKHFIAESMRFVSATDEEWNEHKAGGEHIRMSTEPAEAEERDYKSFRKFARMKRFCTVCEKILTVRADEWIVHQRTKTHMENLSKGSVKCVAGAIRPKGLVFDCVDLR